MEKNRFKITFTGDIMCDNFEIMKEHKFCDFISSGLIERLKSSDFLVGNLETPIVNRVIKNQKYSFAAPIEFSKYLKLVGFDLVSTANNHCLDCGIEGIIENNNNLDQSGLYHVGTNNSFSESRTFYKNINGVNFAFLSFTYGTNAFLNHIYLSKSNSYLVNLLKNQESSNRIYRKLKNKFFENVYFYNSFRDRNFLKLIKNDIIEAQKKSDIVIFLLHSGGQYNKKVDHYTKKLCDYLIQNGVDLVVGNHPHVVLDHTDNIFYSLGNFYATPYSNHNQIDDLPNYSILLDIIVDSEYKKIVTYEYEIIKTEMNGTFPVTKTKEELNTYLKEEVLEIEKKFNNG